MPWNSFSSAQIVVASIINVWIVWFVLKFSNRLFVHCASHSCFLSSITNSEPIRQKMITDSHSHIQILAPHCLWKKISNWKQIAPIQMLWIVNLMVELIQILNGDLLLQADCSNWRFVQASHSKVAVLVDCCASHGCWSKWLNLAVVRLFWAICQNLHSACQKTKKLLHCQNLMWIYKKISICTVASPIPEWFQLCWLKIFRAENWWTFALLLHLIFCTWEFGHYCSRVNLWYSQAKGPLAKQQGLANNWKFFCFSPLSANQVKKRHLQREELLACIATKSEDMSMRWT